MVHGHVFIGTSLDGFIASADGTLDWLEAFQSDATDYGYAAFIAGMDALLMGRRTFETIQAVRPWPYEIPVIVLSQEIQQDQLAEDLQTQVRIWDAGLGAFWSWASQQGWEQLYVDGGQVISAALDQGYIQTMIVSQVPVLLGDGIPLVPTLKAPQRLELTDWESFETGLVQLRYRLTSDSKGSTPS